MDGLLFDTEKIFQQTWNEIAEESGIHLPKDFVGAISGTNGSYMCQVIEKYFSVPDGRKIQDECMKRVKKKLEVYVPKKSGADEILKYFRKSKVHLAVASSSSKEQIENNLEIAGIRSYFEMIVSGNEVEHGKPAPDIFLFAAEKIGCRPEACYVFEDSANGIIAGDAAGCKTVLIPDLVAPTEKIEQLSYRIYDNLLEAMYGIENMKIQRETN